MSCSATRAFPLFVCAGNSKESRPAQALPTGLRVFCGLVRVPASRRRETSDSTVTPRLVRRPRAHPFLGRLLGVPRPNHLTPASTPPPADGSPRAVNGLAARQLDSQTGADAHRVSASIAEDPRRMLSFALWDSPARSRLGDPRGLPTPPSRLPLSALRKMVAS